MEFYIGVDVGTGSVRAGLVSEDGNIVTSSTKEITVYNPKINHYEQSSLQIWEAVKETVNNLLEKSGVSPHLVKGIGFDATCSLVVVDKDGKGVRVSDEGGETDIMMWMDHRAGEEAEIINNTNHPVLEFVGGKVSLEMELPKLMWLKKHRFENTWKEADRFFDLPDWLTYRATGSSSRSLCSLVCKWNYRVSKEGKLLGWDEDLFSSIGLEDLARDGWRAIGEMVLQPGEPVGSGLTKTAALELGLVPGTPVGASLIDAHAGGLGMLTCQSNKEEEVTTRLGLVSGTSTCHMLLHSRPIFVPGVWGPFYSAMMPRLWLTEGGQSSTGGLLDHVISSHPVHQEAKDKANAKGTSVQQFLESRLQDIAREKGVVDLSLLTKDVHIWPDYHGNRSPLADPDLKGMVTGLTLSTDLDSLALKYLATVQAISYGTKHILESMLTMGHQVTSVTVCGGLTRSPLYLSTQADVLQLPVVVPRQDDTVLLGASILGAAANNSQLGISGVMERMKSHGKIIEINRNMEVVKFHQKKYKVFLEMVNDQLKYKKIME